MGKEFQDIALIIGMNKMTDRTDIACMIAEWWHNHKKKKDEINTCEEFINRRYEFSNPDMELIDSEIIVENFMRVESMNPLIISEDYSQLTIRRPDGKKCIIQKFKKEKNNYKKKIELISPVQTVFQVNNCCNSCKFEAYWKEDYDEGIFGEEIEYNRRDCENFKAQEFFKDHVKFTLNKAEIKPAYNCPFWKSKNEKQKIKNHERKRT